MKANELMIGDWVMPLRKSIRKPCQVVSIDGGTNTCWIDSDEYSGLLSCSDLERIPLSTEILEKNGFIIGYDGVYRGLPIGHDNNLKMYHKYIGKAHIVVNYLDDGKVGIEISNEFSPKDDKGRADLVTFARDWCNGFCVHDLQHVLRLCGIEEKIML